MRGRLAYGERRAACPGAGIGRLGLTFGLDLVAPIAQYYGSHAAGVGDLVALSIGAIPPGLWAALKIVTERRVDQLAVIVVVSMPGGHGYTLPVALFPGLGGALIEPRSPSGRS